MRKRGVRRLTHTFIGQHTIVFVYTSCLILVPKNELITLRITSAVLYTHYTKICLKIKSSLFDYLPSFYKSTEYGYLNLKATSSLGLYKEGPTFIIVIRGVIRFITGCTLL